MALRPKWWSRTLAVRDASRWAGTAGGVAPAGDGWAAGAALRSGVLMAGLLPRGGREALGDHLTEHHQDFLTPPRGQARPESRQRLGGERGLRGRGGTRRRCVSDMLILRPVRRDVPGTTAPAAAARSR